MAQTAITATGRTVAEFETNFNAALAAVLTSRINIASFTVVDEVRRNGIEFRVLIMADTENANTITTPYQVEIFTGRNIAEVGQAVEDYIAANPTYWFAAPSLFVVERTRLDDPVIVVVPYNTTAAEGPLNWASGTAGFIGGAGGDLSRGYPNPEVTGIQGFNINEPTVSGQVPMFNGSAIQWTQNPLAYATGPDAVAAAPHILGQEILITTGGSAGLYQVSSNDGSTFPGDYTLLSTSIVVAADWSVVDADNLLQGVDGETVVRELVAPTSTQATSTPHLIASDEHVTIVDLAVPTAVTVQLPASPAADERHTIMDGNGNSEDFTITVSGNGNTIDGATDLFIATNYGALTVQWDDVNGEWKGVSAFRDTPVRKADLTYYSTSLLTPTNTDWAVNDAAPALADGNNPGLVVRAFDDTDEEGVGLFFQIPAGTTWLQFTFCGRAETAPGAASKVVPVLYSRTVPDDAAVTAWNAGTELTALDIPTNEHFQYDSQTLTLTTLGLTAGEVVQFQLTRDPSATDDDLVGDWDLLSIKIEAF